MEEATEFFKLINIANNYLKERARWRVPPTRAGFTCGHITWNLRRENSEMRTSTHCPCAKTPLQTPKNLMTVCYLAHEKRETKNNKNSMLRLFHLTHIQMGSSPPKPTTTKLPPHHLHNSSSSTLPPPHQNMPLQQPSCIKPSVKSPTSFATKETTGTNSAPRQPILQGRTRKLPIRPKNNQNTKLPKTKDSLLPNRSYKKIHTAPCFSPSTMLISSGCTRKPIKSTPICIAFPEYDYDRHHDNFC